MGRGADRAHHYRVVCASTAPSLRAPRRGAAQSAPTGTPDGGVLALPDAACAPCTLRYPVSATTYPTLPLPRRLWRRSRSPVQPQHAMLALRPVTLAQASTPSTARPSAASPAGTPSSPPRRRSSPLPPDGGVRPPEPDTPAADQASGARHGRYTLHHPRPPQPPQATGCGMMLSAHVANGVMRPLPLPPSSPQHHMGVMGLDRGLLSVREVLDTAQEAWLKPMAWGELALQGLWGHRCAVEDALRTIGILCLGSVLYCALTCCSISHDSCQWVRPVGSGGVSSHAALETGSIYLCTRPSDPSLRPTQLVKLSASRPASTLRGAACWLAWRSDPGSAEAASSGHGGPGGCGGSGALGPRVGVRERLPRVRRSLPSRERREKQGEQTGGVTLRRVLLTHRFQPMHCIAL